MAKQFAASKIAHAPNCTSSAQGKPFEQRKRAPNLEPMSHEHVLRSTIQPAGGPRDGQLANVTTDQELSAPAGAKSGAGETDFVATTGLPHAQMLVGVAAELL